MLYLGYGRVCLFVLSTNLQLSVLMQAYVCLRFCVLYDSVTACLWVFYGAFLFNVR